MHNRRSVGAEIFRPPQGRSEREVAAEVIVRLMNAGLIRRTPGAIAEAAGATGVPVKAIKTAWDTAQFRPAVPLNHTPCATGADIVPIHHDTETGASVAESSQSIEELIETGLGSPFKRTQSTARRAREAATALLEAVEGERTRREAAARIARLQEELDEARAQLRGRPAASTRKSGPAGPPPKQVRAWAVANGIDCNATGLVPTRVVDAYRAAHPEG